MTHCLSRLTLRLRWRLPTVDCRICAPISSRAGNLHQFRLISSSTMVRKSGYKSSGSAKQSGQPKRPPLTHFLCLPLVTNTSKPQLEASLSHFEESLSTTFEDGLNAPWAFGQAPRRPLIPPKAIRPVGTIHFTLGVMSLETDERVQQVVEFLNKLDLKSMVEGANGTLNLCYRHHSQPSTYRHRCLQSKQYDPNDDANLDSRPCKHLVDISTFYANSKKRFCTVYWTRRRLQRPAPNSRLDQTDFYRTRLPHA